MCNSVTTVLGTSGLLGLDDRAKEGSPSLLKYTALRATTLTTPDL